MNFAPSITNARIAELVSTGRISGSTIPSANLERIKALWEILEPIQHESGFEPKTRANLLRYQIATILNQNDVRMIEFKVPDEHIESPFVAEIILETFRVGSEDVHYHRIDLHPFKCSDAATRDRLRQVFRRFVWATEICVHGSFLEWSDLIAGSRCHNLYIREEQFSIDSLNGLVQIIQSNQHTVNITINSDDLKVPFERSESLVDSILANSNSLKVFLSHLSCSLTLHSTFGSGN